LGQFIASFVMILGYVIAVPTIVRNQKKYDKVSIHKTMYGMWVQGYPTMLTFAHIADIR
jgi:hypothetical protein